MARLARKITKKQDIFSLLSQITAYRKKKTDCTCKLTVIFNLSLFAVNYQNHTRYLTQHRVAVTDLSIRNPKLILISKPLVLDPVLAETNFPPFQGTWLLK